MLKFGNKKRNLLYRKIKRFYSSGRANKSLEYALVPVLFRATSLADDMTAAALVKGAESPKTAAELFKIKFGIIDYVFALSSIFVVGAAIIFDFDSVFMRLF